MTNKTEFIDRDEEMKIDGCAGLHNHSDKGIYYSFVPFSDDIKGGILPAHTPVAFDTSTVYVRTEGASALIEVFKE